MIDFKGAIFDMDGTLLDSMPVWETVAADYLLTQGITPNDDVREAVRAMSIQQVCEHFCSEYGLKLTNEEITTSINSMVEDFYFHQAPLKQGVTDMLERLKSKGVKMVVATATDRHLVERGLRRTGILDYFERIFTCTEVGAGKDRPDIFHEACSFLGTSLNDTVVFEDALYAVKTAKEAGFKVIALFDESAHEQQELIQRYADHYYSSFTEWNGIHD